MAGRAPGGGRGLAARIGPAALLLVLPLGLAACGYSLAGRGNYLPDYIKAIGVPVFTNLTTTPELDRVVTDAVRAELTRRFRVVPGSTNVDALLTGSVTGVRLDPVAFTQDRQVSRYAVTVTASVELRDLRADRVLWTNPGLAFREEYEVTTSQVNNDPAAFFGQDANALDRLSKNFARSIVTSILEAF